MLTDNCTCRGCGAHSTDMFFQADCVPTSVGRLETSAAEAHSARCGELNLVACHACGLIQNHSYDPEIVGFEPGYQVSLFHSPTFRSFVQGVCDRLIKRYDLQDKKILEIGCGAAEVLRLLCQQGGNHGVGIDPAVPMEVKERFDAGSVHLISDFYSKKYEHHVGDFVCCLSVFEAISSPVHFLRSLRQSIGERDIPVYFEVFNGYRAIAESEVWSVHYEQCNYFSLDSLRNTFALAGFEVTHSGTCYEGDQYLYVEARPSESGEQTLKLNIPAEFSETVRRFGNEFQTRVDWWQGKLDQCRRDQKRVVSWGSGGKGISFLSSLSNADVVQQVVDTNPARQNHYIPRCGQPIVDPLDLKQTKPDVVILTNALYQQEISACLAEMQIECEIVVA